MTRSTHDVIAEVEATFERDPEMETARRLDLVMWAVAEFYISASMSEIDRAWLDAALDWVDSGADDAALPWPPRRRDVTGYRFYVHEGSALIRCLGDSALAGDCWVWWPDSREWSPIEIDVREGTPVTIEAAQEWVDGGVDVLLAGADPSLPILSAPNSRWTPELERLWCEMGFDRHVYPCGDQTFRQARNTSASVFVYWAALEGIGELAEDEVLERLERIFPDAPDAVVA